MGRNSGGIAGSGSSSSGAGAPQEILVSTKGIKGANNSNGQHYHYRSKNDGDEITLRVRETDVFGIKTTAVEITSLSPTNGYKTTTLFKGSFDHKKMNAEQRKKEIEKELGKARKRVNADIKQRFSKQSKDLNDRFDAIAKSGVSNKEKRAELVSAHNFFMKRWGTLGSGAKKKFDKLYKQYS